VVTQRSLVLNWSILLVSFSADKAIGAYGRCTLVDVRNIKDFHSVCLGVSAPLLLFVYYIAQILYGFLRFLRLFNHLTNDLVVLHLILLLLCHLCQSSICHWCNLLVSSLDIGCNLMRFTLFTFYDIHIRLVHYVRHLIGIVR